MSKIVIDIDGYPLTMDIEGERIFGPEEVLLDQDDNLIRQASWAAAGYTVVPFLTGAEHESLREGITALVETIASRHAGQKLEGFRLERYHEFVQTPALHKSIINDTVGGLPVADLPVPIFRLEERVSSLCGSPVTADPPYLPSALFYIRIVRPRVATDNNPPHRDVWLEHLRNCVNIYVPLAGSNESSALPVVPGSHLWKESEIERTATGAAVAGQTYRVPSVTGAKRPLAMVRPNPGPTECTLFSPYLIHGGGVNLNVDLTRVSLEMRFWRKK